MARGTMKYHTFAGYKLHPGRIKMIRIGNVRSNWRRYTKYHSFFRLAWWLQIRKIL